MPRHLILTVDSLPGMPPISYARYQFPPVIIQHSVWLYVRFTLSFREVEDLLAERGELSRIEGNEGVRYD